jgi:hypothetical protein
MLVSRRKRKENKNITVYLNNKILEQVTQMKCLGIILNYKFRFQKHITDAGEKCAKLIHSLSKAAKLTWGIKHETMQLYTMALSYLCKHMGLPFGSKQLTSRTIDRNTSACNVLLTYGWQRRFEPRQARRSAC